MKHKHTNRVFISGHLWMNFLAIVFGLSVVLSCQSLKQAGSPTGNRSTASEAHYGGEAVDPKLYFSEDMYSWKESDYERIQEEWNTMDFEGRLEAAYKDIVHKSKKGSSIITTIEYRQLIKDNFSSENAQNQLIQILLNDTDVDKQVFAKRLLFYTDKLNAVQLSQISAGLTQSDTNKPLLLEILRQFEQKDLITKRNAIALVQNGENIKDRKEAVNFVASSWPDDSDVHNLLVDLVADKKTSKFFRMAILASLDYLDHPSFGREVLHKLQRIGSQAGYDPLTKAMVRCHLNTHEYRTSDRVPPGFDNLQDPRLHHILQNKYYGLCYVLNREKIRDYLGKQGKKYFEETGDESIIYRIKH